MERCNENKLPTIGAKNFQGGRHGGGGKIVPKKAANRRALTEINRNNIGEPSYVIKKTALSEKNVDCGRNSSISVHRPVTRKYASENVNKEDFEVEITERRVQMVLDQKTTKDTAAVNAEDFDMIEDSPVPIFVQHTEAMLEEIDQMEEMEMEDMAEAEGTIAEIDCCDVKNPLAVVEYIHDLYDHYKKTEAFGCVPPNYMEKQYDLNDRMRAILIDWLIEVHHKFELMDETLYLTVNLIDRFLVFQPITRKKLQLVGVTAMLLACKYEEVCVPVVEDFIVITDKAYSRKEILEMERSMLNTLQFKMSVPTPYVFTKRFLKAAQADKKLELLSFFLMELSLVEYEMLKFPPSLLAAAAVYTAQITLSGFRQWTKTSEWYSSYSEEQLLECSNLMVTVHQKAGTGKLTGVYRKYSLCKFGYTAKITPACFLEEGRFYPD